MITVACYGFYGTRNYGADFTVCTSLPPRLRTHGNGCAQPKVMISFNVRTMKDKVAQLYQTLENSGGYPLKLKSDVSHIFDKFHKLIVNFFHAQIKTNYTDGGGEYQALSHLLSKHGI